jgi:hypothetical protein
MSHSRIFGFMLGECSSRGRGRAVLSQQQPFQFHSSKRRLPTCIACDSKRSAHVPARGAAYVNRARAYNGTCNQLVTEEMAPKFLPDYASYAAAVKATAKPAAR